MDSHSKSSAQLERELEAQRTQIGSRIDELRDRLSPGQLLDEALAYTGDGGKDFAQNLGRTVTQNPLPVALMGVSLAWLIAGQNARPAAPQPVVYRPEHDYPYATVNGTMRRVSHKADDAGKWFSEFEDSVGKRYKAASSEIGHRAGHFVDDTGRTVGGFIDETGHRVKDFRDEAGNRLDEAAGWASHTWSDVQHGVADAAGQVAHQAHKLGEQAGHLGEQAGHQASKLGAQAQTQADRTGRAIAALFEQQPLIAGALAFAAGAALGATLPHTDEEDAAVGKLSDKVKANAAEAAAGAYEDGKQKAGELYEKGKEQIGHAYEDASQKAEDGLRQNNPLH